MVTTAVRSVVPTRARGVELLGTVTGSGYRRAPSLVRRGDGQTLQLTPTLYAVLQAIDGERDAAGIAAHVEEHGGVIVEPDDLEFLIETKLRPLGVLREHDGTQPETHKANPLLALRCRVVITNPSITNRITHPFAGLFAPWLVVSLTAAFLGASAWLLFDKGLGAATRQVLYEPGLLLLVFALTMLSAGFHELGHAAACQYGGASPGAMGAGLYLVWPAFYTDVSDSYRLGRGGRLRVDLGGLYFNAVFGVGTFVLWLATGWDALLVVIPLQQLQMLRQLVPIVRLDGYHILADLTGVPDLFARIKPTILGLWPTRWHRPESRVLAPWARAVVTAWVFLIVPALLFSLLLMMVTLPRLAATAWDSLGLQWVGVRHAWNDGDLAGVGLGLISILAVAIPVFSATYMLTRIGRRVWRRIWMAADGNPAYRGAVVVATAALLLAALAAWWPNGQYQPIREDERGTIVEGARSIVGAAAGDPVIATIENASASGRAVGPSALASIGGPPIADAPRLTVPLPETPLTPPRHRFGLPPAPGEGDNQALAVNYDDGTSVFEASFSLVWVFDGVADQRNEAYALASCKDCATSAIAFQLILVVGDAEIVVPENTAVAINALCDGCVTQALARQLILSIAEPLPPEALVELALLWDRFEFLESQAETIGASATLTGLVALEDAVLALLAPYVTSASVSMQTAEETDAGPTTTVPESSTTTLGSDGETSGSDDTSTTATTEPSTTTTNPDESTTTSSTATTEPPEPTSTTVAG